MNLPIPENPTPIEQVSIDMPNDAFAAFGLIVAAVTFAVVVVLGNLR